MELVTTVQLLLLLLIAASGAGLWLARGKGFVRMAIRVLCAFTIPLCVIGCCGTLQCIVGDGGYGQGEFEITFRNSDGRPVPGIRLRVEDGSGREFFLYPVTDYLPDHVPTSDADGRMVFHHVSNGIEFSGGSCEVFFVPVPVRRGPVFICRFLRGDQEVARMPFGELDRWDQFWEAVPKSKRIWQTPIWPTTELFTQLDESFGQWSNRIRKYYDFDGTGRLSPEAAPAYRAATSMKAEEAAIAWLGQGKRIESEIEFALVKRTIIVQDDPK
jgi:hypothetical protein